MTQRTGIYPGTFDPITLGHTDIIERSLNIVDKLVIAISRSQSKNPIFSLDDRVDIANASIKELGIDSNRIVIIPFSGLLVKFAQQQNATILVRGLRAVSDFEYEFQMSCMNSKLSPNIETIFLPASEKTHFVASRFVKEIARLGGDVSGMVSPSTEKRLAELYSCSEH
jgi:pantetheine-phosphate adenylyltransferase